MESVRGVIETEPAWRKGGDDSLAFRFEKLFRQRVEVREVEVAVQAVHGQKDRLLRLRRQRGNLPDVQQILVGPEVDRSMTHIADEGGSSIKGLDDGTSGRGGSQLAQVDLFHRLSRKHGRGQLLRIRHEISRGIRVICYQDQRSAGLS